MVAPSATRGECWGAQLQGIGADACGRLRDRSCRHFRSKFCEGCRRAMAVPVTRVRVLTNELAYMLENRRSLGMWTTAPKRMGSFHFRIVNNTKACRAPALVVFKKSPPKGVPWTTLDPAFLDDNGMVQLCVSKGTVVPSHHTRGRERAESTAREGDLSASSATSTPAPSRASSPDPPDPPDPPPLMQLPNTAVPSMDSPPSSPASSPSPTPPPPPPPLLPFNKESVRMQRNRVSAAASRERKRKYVAHLEQQVNELERAVETLQDENWFWRSLEVDKYDPTCPLWVCEWF